MSKKLSYNQQQAIDILKDGGKIFLFEDGSVGLDTVDGDSYKFRKSTFNSLALAGLIHVVSRPNLGTEIYGIKS